MSGRVLLVRHPPVVRSWAGRCYGSSDVAWSRAGAAMARTLADTLAHERPSAVVHSGLRRTERLSRMIAARIGAALLRDDRWRERDFGNWEGRSWHAIWRETGDLMDRMVTHPDDFRPGGGETTAEVATRAVQAWADLPCGRCVIVVTHGGPIAAVRAHVGGLSLAQMVGLISACGEVVAIGRTLAEAGVQNYRT